VKKRFFIAVFLALPVMIWALGAPSAWAQSPPPQSPPPQSASPLGFPANLRADLVPKWITWADSKAAVSWPPNDGCAASPVAETIPPGTLIDRFGSEGGTFFSPQGETYASRAVPYVCKAMDYRVYKVIKPLPVQSCKAAPWFGEPGGAKQVKTTDPAYKLIASGVLETVSYVPGGSDNNPPQCRHP